MLNTKHTQRYRKVTYIKLIEYENKDKNLANEVIQVWECLYFCTIERQQIKGASYFILANIIIDQYDT